LHVHLFGLVPHDDFEHLQRRLAYESGSRNDGLISLLVAEHPPLITIGRAGSRAHIECDAEMLEREQLEVEYVTRGGGCVLHGPGQLSIAFAAPLVRLKWSVGGYLRRLQQGLEQTVKSLGITPRIREEHFGVWGRSGLLAALGIHVRHGIASYGAYLNVCPETRLHSRIATVAHDAQPSFGALLAEKPSAGRMGNVRATLSECMARALGCEQFELFTGHPLLPAVKHVAKLIA
jgi:lipoyl(octanoyl) transferase